MPDGIIGPADVVAWVESAHGLLERYERERAAAIEQRDQYADDANALGDRVIELVGERDEAHRTLRTLFANLRDLLDAAGHPVQAIVDGDLHALRALIAERDQLRQQLAATDDDPVRVVVHIRRRDGRLQHAVEVLDGDGLPADVAAELAAATDRLVDRLAAPWVQP